MAGLLGEGWDDPRSAAMMALAGGLLQGNVGGGLLAANGAYGDAKQAALKDQFMRMQMQNYQSEIEARQQATQKAKQIQDMMSNMFGAGGVSAPQVSPGAFVPSPSAAGPMGPTMPPSMAAQSAPGSRLGNLSIDQVAALHAAGGPNLLDAYKWVKDPLKLEQGSTYEDRATGQQRYMPKLPDGMAPQGNGFYDFVPGFVQAQTRLAGSVAGAQEGAKAGWDLQTVQPKGQDPQLTTRGRLVTGGLDSTGRTPQQVNDDSNAILSGELSSAQKRYDAAVRSGDQSAAARAQGDIAALQREMAGRKPTVGMPLASEEDKLRASKGVEGDAKTNEARSKDVKTAQQFLSVASQAEKILQSGPTSSGLGSLIDKGQAFFGGTNQGAIASQQLKALGGWLVNNVPRMEGPQSNFDVGNYQRMAADVANDGLPVPARMAALQSIKQMMAQTVNQAGQYGGATGGWEQSGPQSHLSGGGWSAKRVK